MGHQITYPDHGLFYILYELAEDDNVPDFAERFARCPTAARSSTDELGPQLADFLASPRRMPRYARTRPGAARTARRRRASPEMAEAELNKNK